MVCNDCPRECSVDRSRGHGACAVGEQIRVARAAPHFWEEPCISGTGGSGTVFFSGCSLGCVFCQNYQVSHSSFGTDVSEAQLMRIFDRLIEQGVHNLNLVTPTHYSRVLAKVLSQYHSPVPVVWNSGGYEKVETLKMLEGLVDIYLPDIKYYDDGVAKKYSLAPNYFEYASRAAAEMCRQVGGLVTDADGIAQRGVILRHLVLPGNTSQAFKVFEWAAENLPQGIAVSLMRQYVPYGRAKELPPLDRRLSAREYALAKRKILSLGFENCYFQHSQSASQEFIPDFDLTGIDEPTAL